MAEATGSGTRLRHLLSVSGAIAMSDLAEAADVTVLRRRVENGLIHTRPSDRTNSNAGRLTERMALLAVPGVSVAVINGGAVEWTRGYGRCVAGGEEPVTADTLFQAA